jgi:hypothetical protein
MEGNEEERHSKRQREERERAAREREERERNQRDAGAISSEQDLLQLIDPHETEQVYSEKNTYLAEREDGTKQGERGRQDRAIERDFEGEYLPPKFHTTSHQTVLPRCSHSASMLELLIVIFGGRGEKSCFTDAWEFNTSISMFTHLEIDKSSA